MHSRGLGVMIVAVLLIATSAEAQVRYHIVAQQDGNWVALAGTFASERECSVEAGKYATTAKTQAGCLDDAAYTAWQVKVTEARRAAVVRECARYGVFGEAALEKLSGRELSDRNQAAVQRGMFALCMKEKGFPID
jgi:hypothetical protein